MDKPIPQWSFANVTSSQWTTIATWLLIGPAGIYYKALAIKYGFPVPDPDSLGNLLMQAVPWAVGAGVAWWRRTEPKVLELAARILAAQQHPAALAVAQAAQIPPKPTGTTLLPLLAMLALFPGLLGGCSNGTINAPTVSTVAADVNLVAGGLQNALATLPSSGVNVSPENLTLAANSVAGIKALAINIGSAGSTAAAQPLVQQIETYVNAFVASVGTALAPCNTSTCNQIKAYVSAANLLLPVIEIAVNMAVPNPPATPTADAARATLAAPAPAK